MAPPVFPVLCLLLGSPAAEPRTQPGAVASAPSESQGGFGFDATAASKPAVQRAKAPTATKADSQHGDEAALEAVLATPELDEVGATGRNAWRQGCTQGRSLAGHTCVRSPRVRAWFALGGALAAGTGAALLLLVGDALHAGDPGAMMMGIGGITLGGATIGALAGLKNGDRPAPPDRVRPSTIGLEGIAGDSPVLGESAPGSVNLRLAPTWYFPDGDGRLRLLGRVGGMLGPRVDVDPRAQEVGTFDAGLSERSWAADVALDLAVSLPYPLLRRPVTPKDGHPPGRGYLGAWEIRYKPSLSMRRENYTPAGEYQTRHIERMMLLPLTVGARSHFSQRQRLTFYAGPRFDFVSFAVGDGALERGPASVSSLYGEAWYDLDFPHLLRGAAAARYTLRGQLTAGYVHTRFDGRGANLGTAIGFMGPFNFAWRMRLHKLERAHAWQFGVGAWVGNGIGSFVELGVSLPDLGPSPVSQPSLPHSRSGKRRRRTRSQGGRASAPSTTSAPIAPAGAQP